MQSYILQACAENFNPRPPRGGRHYVGYRLASFNEISIHALREEGDLHAVPCAGCFVVISIHALRAEGDFQCSHKMRFGA